jgi:hypothetical protein
MASTPEGILGSLVGRIGPVTGYKKAGQSILRSSTSQVHYVATPKRVLQQQKLQLAKRFVKAFSGSGFFDRSYAGMASRGYGYHKAISAIMNLAIKSNGADGFNISYNDVLVSRGLLPTAQAAMVEVAGSQLVFHWANNSHDGTAKPNDQTILVAYAAATVQTVWHIGTANRKDSRAMLDVQALNGLMVETWIGFVNTEGSQASNSVYTGSMQL